MIITQYHTEIITVCPQIKERKKEARAVHYWRDMDGMPVVFSFAWQSVSQFLRGDIFLISRIARSSAVEIFGICVSCTAWECAILLEREREIEKERESYLLWVQYILLSTDSWPKYCLSSFEATVYTVQATYSVVRLVTFGCDGIQNAVLRCSVLLKGWIEIIKELQVMLFFPPWKTPLRS